MDYMNNLISQMKLVSCRIQELSLRFRESELLASSPAYRKQLVDLMMQESYELDKLIEELEAYNTFPSFNSEVIL